MTSDSKPEKKLLPTYTHHENYSYFLMPQGFPTENFKTGLQYKAQANDLFVATYPKCGTTWMQHICYLILNNGTPLAADQELTHMFPHLEEMGAGFINDESNFVPLAYPQQEQQRDGENGSIGQRLIKTHLYYEMTPTHPQAKYVYVARNPKDCVVSFFHHTRGFVKHYNFANGSFDDFFDLFMEGKVDFGDYFHSLKSWVPHLQDPNIFYVSYEALKQHPKEHILDISEFLGGQSLRNHLLDQDGKILNQVLDHSSFGSMSKDVGRWSSARPKDHTPFVRKGTVGDWRNMLSREQSNRMDEKMKECFTEEELKALWPNYESIMSYEP